jgi:pyruvate dehydrogenase E1 component alpha subunit
MNTVQCDGNDIFAVVYCVKEAARRARETNLPCFIEGVTYRLADHTTADDARRYRDEDEVELWRQRDPLVRIREYMKSRNLWDDSKEATLAQQAEVDVAAAVKRAEEIDPLTITDFFETMYQELPPDLELQKRTMRTSSIGEDPSQIESTEASQA